jgi:hypothetical protein
MMHSQGSVQSRVCGLSLSVYSNISMYLCLYIYFLYLCACECFVSLVQSLYCFLKLYFRSFVFVRLRNTEALSYVR